jgi:predicted transposase/invertase (TIGR01784 family)
MDGMNKRKAEGKQGNKYDKILHENIEAALPGLIEKVLGIQVVNSEELPDNIQYTKERKPDVLKKVTDDKGETFVLHIEFQTRNDPGMVFRMGEYLFMLLRSYRLRVRQYVIYIGESTLTMADKWSDGKSTYCYDLLPISSVDYHIFLRAANPEEKMFAILADFGKEDPQAVVAKITNEVVSSANGELERERRKNQFRILAQLRTLVSKNIEIMEHVSSFFKEENDIFYQVGEKKGVEKGKAEVVTNLLAANRFTIAEITSLAGVTEAFVEKVKKTVK